MITATGIQDQELAIGAETAGKLDMAVGRRGHLRLSAGANEQPFDLAAKAIAIAEAAENLALCGIFEMPAGVNKVHARLQSLGFLAALLGLCGGIGLNLLGSYLLPLLLKRIHELLERFGFIGKSLSTG